MTREQSDLFDLVGVGFGPANIGLAVALEEVGWNGSALFLERREAPDWQPGMLLDGADIQHNPLRDFVTPRNPLSRFSFLNFLKSEDRLFQFLNLPTAFPLRKEYAAYVRWVANQFDHCVSYGSDVIDISLEGVPHQQTQVAVVHLADGRTLRARSISFAPGRTPAVPAVFSTYLGDRIVHFTDYLPARERWRRDEAVKSVCVVGGSQSAVEITLDLASVTPPVDIVNLHRGFGYQLKDTSPFTEEIYFPQFVETFYRSSSLRRQELWAELRRSNYGSADRDVIEQLYCKLYEHDLDGRRQISLRTNCSVVAVSQAKSGTVELLLEDRGSFERTSLSVDAVVLATGFRNLGLGEHEERFPPLLRKIAIGLGGERNVLSLSRDYRMTDGPRSLPIFVNGLCESSHGFGDAGSFSLLSLRSQMIADSLIELLSSHVHAASRREQPAVVAIG
ncbi:putative oxidoreductase oxidoreductase protein [Bradyrhizobium sp. ORS 375]|uniref:SidA/IucD/PvdA family monooxygenase n=1 Tax=Bradyrhizobium sp. (strain ORS 375) TaxID=566679 RepID=UPI0002406AAD|nr:SidA/IucD/PvdA family monooxygenase [Bradyrhizobium sp. ORS 375]CCD96739.1 putative oxidoreductase oxidoreductase protein [Bradyrhizobium sp. ORS 375]